MRAKLRDYLLFLGEKESFHQRGDVFPEISLEVLQQRAKGALAISKSIQKTHGIQSWIMKSILYMRPDVKGLWVPRYSGFLHSRGFLSWVVST